MTEEELYEKFEKYKAGKYIGRQEMMGILLDEICELKRRIGAVDEAAVAALNERLAAHELVVGNALRAAEGGDEEPGRLSMEPQRRGGWPKGRARKPAQEAA